MARINLSIIRAEVKSRVHDSGISNTSIDRWANLAQDQVIRSMDPDWLEETATFSCVASTRRYLLKNVAIGKVKSVVDESSTLKLVQESESYIDNIDPAHDQEGDPYLYCLYGVQTFASQIGTAGVVTAVSSSASDTTQTVHIKGTNASGYLIKETLTLNGTTAVSTTASFTTVTDITKSDVTTGYISVTDAGTVTLVVIPGDKLSQQYQPIILFPTPSGTNTIRVRYIRTPRDLVEAEDEPDIPEMWHDAVLLGTIKLAHEYLYEFDNMAIVKAEYDEVIKKLKQEMGNSRDNSKVIRLPSLKRGKRGKGRLPDVVG